MSETIALGDKDVAYLVGKAGETRMRLEKFSGAQLSIDSDVVKISGTDEAREVRAARNSSARNYSIFGEIIRRTTHRRHLPSQRARLAIEVTLQQRQGGSVKMDFDAIEDRADVSTFDVPRETIGFLLGKSGITLRGMENKYSVFMFLDNDRQREGKHGPCKRLYVVGNGNDREAALDEAEEIVRFKLTGQSSGRGGPPRGPPPGAAYRSLGADDRGPPPRDRYDDRGPPPRYDDDRRGPPPPRYRSMGADDDRYDRGPPPRYDDYDRRGPPPPRDDYYERRGPPPPRYDDRYDDRRGPPPPRYDDRYDRGPPPDDRYDDRRGPPPDDRCRPHSRPSPGSTRARARRLPRAARHRYGERRPEYDRGPPPDDRRRDYERRDYPDDDRQRDYHYR